MNDRELLTVEEAGRRLSLGRSKVYELMNLGHLTSLSIGRSRRVPARAILEFIEAQLEQETEVESER